MNKEPEKTVALEAASPYELRVDLAKNVSEIDVKAAVTSGDVGFLHSFTTGSTLDGPGVRVVIWTAGCMWRCQYCHNPDTWIMKNGQPVTVERATEQLRKYSQGLKVMSGGLTISGGEPLMQDRFVVKMFKAARAMGVHTALDSNGFYGERLTDADLESVNLVLLDLKAWDEDRHMRLTRREPGPTREFAKRLAARRVPIWVRFVLVPDLTDDPGEVANIARFAASLGNVERVDVLPFHQMGRYKWHKLGIPYKLEDVEPPSTELVERVISTFRAEGLKAC